MARVGRLAGAILAETGGDYYLVGNPKQPCDWRAAGFEPPIDIDARTRPVLRLARCGAPSLAAPVLVLEVEGDALPRLLADAFVIQRTGSVSERLWRLAIGSSVDPNSVDPNSVDPNSVDPSSDEPGDASPPPDAIAARWLGEMPPAIWDIVRDTVLRCT